MCIRDRYDSWLLKDIVSVIWIVTLGLILVSVLKVIVSVAAYFMNMDEWICMAIIVALAGWYAKTLIDLKIDCAVFESRLSSIEERIDELDADNITREILELQLNALKQELLSGSTLQAANLSNRIDLLERQIELLQ